jgi:hypothetical protein
VSSAFFFLLGLVVVGALAYAALRAHGREKHLERRRFIQRFVVPVHLRRKLREHYPDLGASHEELVVEALKDYFNIALAARRKLVAMPSKAVDALWHEFILSTHDYHAFCKKAFGYYLHHVPQEAMARPESASQSLKRCWKIACESEGIDPLKPPRLPRLFRVDAELNIADGYRYELDCSKTPRANSNTYCGSHMGCTSCGGGGSAGDWSDATGAAGGDAGGSSCGGGDCGGGGD